MITYGTIIECLWFVLSKISLLCASNNFSEMIVWWQNNMRLQCKIISLKWTVWLALDIALKTPQGPNTYLHYIPRDPITFISEWDLMGEVMAGKGLSKKKGRAPELPLLLQKLVPETLKFPAAESQLILSLSIGTCGLVFRRAFSIKSSLAYQELLWW